MVCCLGYSYDYLSPDNFQFAQAIVTNNVLAASGPAHQALIIRSTDLLTLDSVTAVAKYAKSGLPIVISGGIPTQIASSTGLLGSTETLGGHQLIV